MSEEEKVDEGEKTRTCPSCRMSVSVLAVRCRFCGEEIGRPKEAVRELSASDLGGETIYHRAPSGSLLDAMESFRMEEQTEPTPSPEEDVPAIDAMPMLDEGVQDVMSMNSQMSSVAPSAKPSQPERAKTLIFAVVGLLVLVFAGVKGVGMLQEYAETPDEPPPAPFVNRAVGMLNSGSSGIDALAVAVEALTIEPSIENTKIAEQAFAKVTEDVEALLDRTPFNRNNIRDASLLASRAADIYPNAASLGLKNDVERENLYYKMNLMDVTDGVATFSLSAGGDRKVSVKRGDEIDDRYYVLSVVGETVKLEDMQRDGRMVVWPSPGALPE